MILRRKGKVYIDRKTEIYFYISDSFGDRKETIKYILADPQTSGGLLIAVDPKEVKSVEVVLKEYFPDQTLQSIGYFMEKGDYAVTVK